MKRRGFSLIEVMIAMAILVVLAGVVYMLLFRSSKHVRTMSVQAMLDDEARSIIDEITRDLRAAATTSIVITGSNTLTMSAVTGVTMSGSGSATPTTGFNVTWSSSLIAPEALNNIDDTLDGLVDEHRITRADTQNNVTITRTARATASGLTFVETNQNNRKAISVTVTLQGNDDKGSRILRSFSSTVVIRN